MVEFKFSIWVPELYGKINLFAEYVWDKMNFREIGVFISVYEALQY